MGRCRPARDGKAKFPRVGRWQACCEKRDAASEVIVVVIVVIVELDEGWGPVAARSRAGAGARADPCAAD